MVFSCGEGGRGVIRGGLAQVGVGGAWQGQIAERGGC